MRCKGLCGRCYGRKWREENVEKAKKNHRNAYLRANPLPDDAVTCPLCGESFQRLGVHLRRIHQISPDGFRAAFPHVLLIAKSLSDFLSERMRETLHGLNEVDGGVRSKRCKKGHYVTGDNVYVVPSTGEESCIKCNRQSRRKRETQNPSVLCLCGCGRKTRYGYVKNHRPRRKRGWYKTCATCGSGFYVPPSLRDQRFCSHSCLATARWRSGKQAWNRT